MSGSLSPATSISTPESEPEGEVQPREGNKVAQGHAVSQPRKWDDQGCLRGWSNAPTPGSQDRTCLLLSLRSSGHRGPHPSLSLRSASGDESAAARPHALLGSFPLFVPAIGKTVCICVPTSGGRWGKWDQAAGDSPGGAPSLEPGDLH